MSITREEMIADAADYVVVDDGQFRYPVAVEDLREGDSEGSIRAMDGDEYGMWCQAVPCDQRLCIVGSGEMVDLCADLIAAGADIWYVG